MEDSGRLVGHYVLGSMLGRGSFAVVWKGKHVTTARTVAVKEINVKMLNAKLKQSLECEVSILQRVEHQNIVRLLETFEEKDRMYLVMEFCSGGDLAHYIRRCKRVSEATAQSILVQLAAGLREMWAHNFVHRDLKPQNLLLSDSNPQAILKIADFGFARDLQPQGLAETLCGSPLYMAPEILHFRKYDAKADLWSVGTILYELLVGHPPFNGDNHVQLLRNIEKHVPRIPTNLQLSPPCRNLLAMLLKKNPVERISFEEFFSHPWLLPAVIPMSLQVPPTAGFRSTNSTDTGYANGMSGGLPFMMDSNASGTACASEGHSSGKGAPPMLLSSTRLDALMGPLTLSSSSQNTVDAPSYSAMMRESHGILGKNEGDGEHEEEEGYVVVSGPSSGSAAAAAYHYQPRSPTNLATMKLRSFAALWHPLVAQLGHSPPMRLGERRLSAPSATSVPSHRSLVAQQKCSPQPAVRNSVKRSFSTRNPAPTGPKASGASIGAASPQQISPHRHSTGSWFGCLSCDDSPDGPLPGHLLLGDHAAALEQVANVLEGVAGSKTRSGQSAHSLAFRLIAIQLLQLGITTETKRLSKHGNESAICRPAETATPQQLPTGVATIAPGKPPAVPRDAAMANVSAAHCSPTLSGSALRSFNSADAPPCSTEAVVSLTPQEPFPSSAASPAGGKDSIALILRLKSRERVITGLAVFNASSLSRSGAATTHLPDVWEAAYNAALDLSQAAAVDETLGELKAAARTYTQSVAIMHFLACIAGSLPLEPQLQLSPLQLARVQKYYAAISQRASAVAASILAAKQTP